MSLLRSRRRRLRLLLMRPWLPPALGRRTRPFPLTLNRFAAVLFVFIFGIDAFFLRSPWPLETSRYLPGGCDGVLAYGETGLFCQAELRNCWVLGHSMPT